MMTYLLSNQDQHRILVSCVSKVVHARCASISTLPATGNLYAADFLHDIILYFEIVIFCIVAWLVITVLRNFTVVDPSARLNWKAIRRFLIGGSAQSGSTGRFADAILRNSNWKWLLTNVRSNPVKLEIYWTILPALVLVAIAVPSFAALYVTDVLSMPCFTVKIVGQQWFWTYAYVDSDYETDPVEVHPLALADLAEGEFRNLETDFRLVLPTNTAIRFVVTALDVIHSFSVPKLGVKIDAMPGRLNVFHTVIADPGVYFGVCMELCGVNHGYMPIVIEACPVEEFVRWRAVTAG